MPGVHVKTASTAGKRGTAAIGPARRIADELRAQNERFAAAVENMSHGLCMFDADERMIICNRNYIDLFRLDAKVVKPGIRYFDILQHSVDVGVASQSAEELHAIRKPYIDGARPSTYEEVLSDGRIIVISHRPIAVGGWVSIYEDVTERRRAEAELKEQHRRFDAALANMSQGLLMYSAEGRLIVRNQRFLDLCNAKAADFTLGMTHRQMLEKLVALGIFVPVEVDIEVEKAKAALDAGQPRSSYRELVDG
ncbi:PAS-domain containing protein, partial [Mesorhizobium sp.]|uniref:PAS domain-containing protein n=2 Tax=Mesorhizobium sp. TaxID=1871066 RepID=UPI0025B917DC